MNKKAEVFTIAMVLLFVLVASIVYYEGTSTDKKYMGDKLSGVVYNTQSNNSNCSPDTITIDTKNIELFATEGEAVLQGYNLSVNCT